MPQNESDKIRTRLFELLLSLCRVSRHQARPKSKGPNQLVEGNSHRSSPLFHQSPSQHASDRVVTHGQETAAGARKPYPSRPGVDTANATLHLLGIRPPASQEARGTIHKTKQHGEWKSASIPRDTDKPCLPGAARAPHKPQPTEREGILKTCQSFVTAENSHDKYILKDANQKIPSLCAPLVCPRVQTPPAAGA